LLKKVEEHLPFWQDGDYSIVIRKCNHAFHPQCLRQWLDRRHTCPMCRCVSWADTSNWINRGNFQTWEDSFLTDCAEHFPPQETDRGLCQDQVRLRPHWCDVPETWPELVSGGHLFLALWFCPEAWGPCNPLRVIWQGEGVSAVQVGVSCGNDTGWFGSCCRSGILIRVFNQSDIKNFKWLRRSHWCYLKFARTHNLWASLLFGEK
jgi:hypothetical protein